MKITLTVEELTALVVDRYLLPLGTVLEISDYIGVENPDATTLIATLRSNDCLDSKGFPRPDKKIASIKLLRELVIRKVKFNACGLCQAKYAIEDWDRFIAYVRKYGYPNMASNADNYGWHKNP